MLKLATTALVIVVIALRYILIVMRLLVIRLVIEALRYKLLLLY